MPERLAIKVTICLTATRTGSPCGGAVVERTAAITTTTRPIAASPRTNHRKSLAGLASPVFPRRRLTQKWFAAASKSTPARKQKRQPIPVLYQRTDAIEPQYSQKAIPLIGITLLALILLGTLIGPYLVPNDPLTANMAERLRPPRPAGGEGSQPGFHGQPAVAPAHCRSGREAHPPLMNIQRRSLLPGRRERFFVPQPPASVII